MGFGFIVANLVLQAVIFVTALAAMWLAKKRRLKRHCLVMRVAVGIQIVLVAAIMGPRLGVLLPAFSNDPKLYAEFLVHHVLGLIVVLLFAFFNLVMAGVIKFAHRLRPYMWTAFGAWVVVLALGGHLYYYVWR